MDPDSFLICRFDECSSINYGNLWQCVIIFLKHLVFQTFAVCFQFLPFPDRPSCVCFTSSPLFSTSYSQESQLNLLCLLISVSSLNLQEIWYSCCPRSSLVLVEIFSVGPPQPWCRHLYSFCLLFIKVWGISFSKPVRTVTSFNLFQAESLNVPQDQPWISSGPPLSSPTSQTTTNKVRKLHQTSRQQQGWSRCLHGGLWKEQGTSREGWCGGVKLAGHQDTSWVGGHLHEGRSSLMGMRKCNFAARL